MQAKTAPKGREKGAEHLRHGSGLYADGISRPSGVRFYKREVILRMERRNADSMDAKDRAGRAAGNFGLIPAAWAVKIRFARNFWWLNRVRSIRRHQMKCPPKPN
jgi:hypothetical protein